MTCTVDSDTVAATILDPRSVVTGVSSIVSTITCSSYHVATCTLQACDAETNSKIAENHNYHSTTMSARAAVNKYNPISYFCISAALLSHDCTAQRHRRKQATVCSYCISQTHSTDAHTHDFNDRYSLWVDWVLRLANSERHWNCTAHFQYRGSIEYRDTWDGIVIAAPISGIAQHYCQVLSIHPENEKCSIYQLRFLKHPVRDGDEHP